MGWLGPTAARRGGVSDARISGAPPRRLLREDRARPRPGDGPAPAEVALRVPDEARGRASTDRPAIEVRSRRVRRADPADPHRLPHRVAAGDRAHGPPRHVRLVLAEHAQPRDGPHRLAEAGQGRRRCPQRALRHAARVGSAAVVEEGQGLLPLRRGAGYRAAVVWFDAAGNRRPTPRGVRRGRSHHQGHAGFVAPTPGVAGRRR